MPPRYAYWTILVDHQPTAFRAAMQEDLMPTFKRLKQKHPSAEMKWFQNGKLWNSRVDAQEAMRERGERGRQGDARQGGGFRDRKRTARSQQSLEWKPKPEAGQKLEWKPKGEFTPAPKRSARPEHRERLEWKPRSENREPEPNRTRPGTRNPKPGTFRRDKTWRPGGEHRDPRQKYKDAKKAKWQRFKKAIRTKWEAKQGPRKKRRDDES